MNMPSIAGLMPSICTKPADNLFVQIARTYGIQKVTELDDSDVEGRAVDVLHNMFKINIAVDMKAVIDDAMEMHVMTFGARPAEDPVDWDGNLEDALTDALEPWKPVLSENWFGKTLMGAVFGERDFTTKIANSATTEAWVTVTTGKTPAQIMSSGNILLHELKSYILNRVVPVFNLGLCYETLEAILSHSGPTYDPMYMMDMLDNASDTDDGLAFGAMTRLVPDADQDALDTYINSLRDARREKGAKAVDWMVDALGRLAENPESFKSASLTAEVASPAVPAPVQEVPAPAARAARTPRATGPNVPPEVFNIIKGYTGTTADSLKDHLGVSRASASNYMTGKTLLAADASQKVALRGLVWTHLTQLALAMSMLDGIDYNVVQSND